MVRDSNSPELASSESLAQFVRDWEEGRVAPSDWTHAAHVAMAAHYLQTLPKAEVLPVVREGLLRFAKQANIPNRLGRGYHESLTVFWMEICDGFLKCCGKTGIDAARALVDLYGTQSKLHKDYYSYDVVMSAEAKANWVPPDAKPLT